MQHILVQPLMLSGVALIDIQEFLKTQKDRKYADSFGVGEVEKIQTMSIDTISFVNESYFIRVKA